MSFHRIAACTLVFATSSLTAEAEPLAPVLGRFSLGDDRTSVLSRLGADASRVVCTTGSVTASRCSLSVAPDQQRVLPIHGMRFANWTFSFSENRLVSIAASATVAEDGDDAHIAMLVALANQYGKPTVKQSAGPGGRQTDARWVSPGGQTLSFHRLVTPDGPLGRNSMYVLFLADNSPLLAAREDATSGD